MEAQTQKSEAEQLRSWQEREGTPKHGSKSATAKAMGIPESTYKDYLSGKNAIKRPEARALLYKGTGLDVFKFEGYEKYLQATTPATLEQPKEVRQSQDDKIVDSLYLLSLQLDKVRRDVRRVLPDVSKKYDIQERAVAVRRNLEELAVSLEPFRTGTAEEQKVLVDELGKHGDVYAYVEQMIKIFQQQSGREAWLRLAQPPNIVRKIMEGK